MVRATLMARHSLVYSSMMFSILMVLPSSVTSNWLSSAHKTFGRMGDIAPTWVPVPVSRFLRLRCGTRRPSSRHRRRMRLSLTARAAKAGRLGCSAPAPPRPVFGESPQELPQLLLLDSAHRGREPLGGSVLTGHRTRSSFRNPEPFTQHRHGAALAVRGQ